jgi:hypothetical protein
MCRSSLFGALLAVAFSWSPLSYHESVWFCGNGDLQACDSMYAYELDRAGGRGTLSTPVLGVR